MKIQNINELFEEQDRLEKSLCKELQIPDFKDSYAALIKQVEQLHKEDVWFLLFRHDIPFHSEDFRDYSEAKRIVFKGLWIDEKKYDAMITWICEYLNV
jgi:hypothetical protein